MTSGRSPSSAAGAARTTCSTGTWRKSGPGPGFTLRPGRLATSWNSVWTGPGQSAVTITPQPHNSARSASEKLLTYALVAAYTAVPGIGRNPAEELTFKIAP